MPYRASVAPLIWCFIPCGCCPQSHEILLNKGMKYWDSGSNAPSLRTFIAKLHIATALNTLWFTLTIKKPWVALHTALHLKYISIREKSKVTSLTWPKTYTAGSSALPSIYQSEITEANIKKLKACKQILISLYGTWHLMIDRMHIVKSAKKNQGSDHENWSPKKPLLRLKTLQVIALDNFTQRNKTC